MNFFTTVATEQMVWFTEPAQQRMLDRPGPIREVNHLEGCSASLSTMYWAKRFKVSLRLPAFSKPHQPLPSLFRRWEAGFLLLTKLFFLWRLSWPIAAVPEASWPRDRSYSSFPSTPHARDANTTLSNKLGSMVVKEITNLLISTSQVEHTSE